MKLGYLLLGVLLRHPSTGYDLKRFLDQSGRFLRPRTQMSQVYRVLADMERRGWAVHTVEPRPGAQDAKTYRVTEEGVTVFLDWLMGPYQPTPRYQDSELDARLTFGGFSNEADLVRILDIEIAARQDDVRRFRHRDRTYACDSDIAFDSDLARTIDEWSHRRGVAATDAYIASCIELRDELVERMQAKKFQDSRGVLPPGGETTLQSELAE